MKSIRRSAIPIEVQEHRSTFTPQLVEEAAAFHFVEKATIDEILGFDLFGARVDAGDFVQNRLQTVVVKLEIVFEDFDLAVVCRVEDFAVREAQIFSHDFVDKFLIGVNDLAGLRHRSKELSEHGLTLGDNGPARHEDRRGVGKFECGAVNEVVQAARDCLGVGGRVERGGVKIAAQEGGKCFGGTAGLGQINFRRIDARSAQRL